MAILAGDALLAHASRLMSELDTHTVGHFADTFEELVTGQMRETIGAAYGLDPARIVCGTGSDELLMLTALAFAGPGDEVLFSQYGFLVYKIAALAVTDCVVWRLFIIGPSSSSSSGMSPKRMQSKS